MINHLIRLFCCIALLIVSAQTHAATVASIWVGGPVTVNPQEKSRLDLSKLEPDINYKIVCWLKNNTQPFVEKKVLVLSDLAKSTLGSVLVNGTVYGLLRDHPVISLKIIDNMLEIYDYYANNGYLYLLNADTDSPLVINECRALVVPQPF